MLKKFQITSSTFSDVLADVSKKINSFSFANLSPSSKLTARLHEKTQ